MFRTSTKYSPATVVEQCAKNDERVRPQHEATSYLLLERKEKKGKKRKEKDKLISVLWSVGCLQQRNSVVDFRGKEVSDGNRSNFRRISAEMFTEIGISTEMGLSRGSGNFVENVPHVHRGL